MNLRELIYCYLYKDKAEQQRKNAKRKCEMG